MYDYNIAGEIKQIKPVQTINSKNGEFKKKNFILLMDGKFDNYIELTISGKRIDEFDISEGERVNVKFFINGKQWKDKIIHNFNVINIEILSSYKTETDDKFSSVDGVQYNEPNEKQDDLPF